MKKENRKMAQEKRAAQRKKQEQKNKVTTFLKIGIPVLLIVVLIILIVVDPFSSSNADSDSNTSNDTISEETAYLTDSSLTVEDGDTVNIDYVGSIDGVEFSGGNTQGYGADLTIGSGSYIDDFEEQLIGYHPGDTVEVVVTFPEDYGNEELNGKEAVFVTTINGIYE